MDQVKQDQVKPDQVNTDFCEKCCSDKNVVLLIKNTEQKHLCIDCFDTQILYDGWKNKNFELCEECHFVIDRSKECINILIKNVYLLLKNGDDKKWCAECFDKLWREAYNDGWRGDDIKYELDFNDKYF